MAGRILWVAGGTTAEKEAVGRGLAEALRRRGVAVECITGEEVERYLASGLPDTEEGRTTLRRRVGFLAHLLARNDIWVVLTAEVPAEAVWAELQEAYGGFHLIAWDEAKTPAKPWVRLTKGLSPEAMVERLVRTMEAQGWFASVP